MRQMSFEGYLKTRLKKLSGSGSLSIFKLAHEYKLGNARIKEPLCMYAIESGKTDILFRAVSDDDVYSEYLSVINSKNKPHNYEKLYDTYKSIYCASESESEIKSDIRRKVISWQKSRSISNYRIYTDLHLNPGNINAWLKHGDSSKISLSTAGRILKYVQR